MNFISAASPPTFRSGSSSLSTAQTPVEALHLHLHRPCRALCAPVTSVHSGDLKNHISSILQSSLLMTNTSRVLDSSFSRHQSHNAAARMKEVVASSGPSFLRRVGVDRAGVRHCYVAVGVHYLVRQRHEVAGSRAGVAWDEQPTRGLKNRDAHYVTDAKRDAPRGRKQKLTKCVNRHGL
jgi:hypothetical protein